MNFGDFLDETARIDDDATEAARAEVRADPYAGEEPTEEHLALTNPRAAWRGATFHADGRCDCPAGVWNTGEAPF